MYHIIKLFSLGPYSIDYKLMMIKTDQKIWETPKDFGNA